MVQIYVNAVHFINHAGLSAEGLRLAGGPVIASPLDTIGHAAVAELVDALP